MFKDLIGKTIIKIEGMEIDSEEIYFICNDGSQYRMYYSQDYREYVYLEDINGNIDNILNSEVLKADEKEEENKNASESGTYTFYTIATAKGYLDLRWNGESNGYYSETVEFEKINEN